MKNGEKEAHHHAGSGREDMTKDPEAQAMKKIDMEVEEEEAEEWTEARATEDTLARSIDEDPAQGPVVMVGPLQATTWLG